MRDGVIPPSPHQSLQRQIPSSPQDLTQEITDVLSGDRLEKVEELLARLLPTQPARVRGNVAKVVMDTIQGGRTLEVLERHGVGWAQINAWSRNIPAFQALWHAANDAGEEYRKLRRRMVADSRAVDGVDEPVWYKGEQCGVMKRFDNRLLEFLLEADDPGKYRKGTEGVKVNVQVAQIMDALKGTGVSSLVNSGAPRLAPNRADAPPAPEHAENPSKSHDSE